MARDTLPQPTTDDGAQEGYSPSDSTDCSASTSEASLHTKNHCVVKLI